MKGLAALIAVVTVNVGGAHVGIVQKPVNNPVTAVRATPDAITDLGKDAFLLRGQPPVQPTPSWAKAMSGVAERLQASVPPPPPADSPAANEPLAQLPIGAAPRSAPPSIVIGSTQQALINQDRAAAGLGPLTWSSCLAGIAYQNAARMANAGAISHAGGASQDLGCGLGSQGGENVGYWSGGITDSQLNAMFMNSAGHRANIMGPYRYVGTAWVVARNGAAYIAVEFS
ncbi:MAG: CAP domain-containing protein [Candidatus Dormibacteraeota bacterium]|nr:CAP domain-containing protein [Candidatus Dormibacteraeota bacterium]